MSTPRDLIWREEALDRVRAVRRSFYADRSAVEVPLDEIAGRRLATDIVAEEDSPRIDQGTMDGYAIDATAGYPLELREGEVFPGVDPPNLEPGEAIRIATGAPLPEGTNAVLKQEEATVTDGQLQGPDLEVGTYTYRRGSNLRAGERVIAAGERLAPKDAILLRDLGFETIPTIEPLSVGLLATGTEIHEGRTPDQSSPMILGLVRSWGHDIEFAGTVPDDPARVTDRIAALADEHDVVLTTGGTSVGTGDHVIRALAELGRVDFHRVRIRPGKPIALAMLPDAVAFAIPGKPIGAHTAMTLVSRPFFVGDAPLSSLRRRWPFDLNCEPEGFEYVVPVVLEDGEIIPLGHVDSPLKIYDTEFDPSVLSASSRAARAHGFVLTEGSLAADEPVDVIPYAVVE